MDAAQREHLDNLVRLGEAQIMPQTGPAVAAALAELDAARAEIERLRVSHRAVVDGMYRENQRLRAALDAAPAAGDTSGEAQCECDRNIEVSDMHRPYCPLAGTGR